MKKILITLVTTSTIILSIAGCNSPNNTNSINPSSNPSPGASSNPSPGGNASSKATVIAVYNCVKVKAPELALAMDAYISAVNAATDANWTRDSAAIQKGLSNFEAYGCKV